MVGPSASKRSLSHIFMSIFDTGSNGRGFGKGKDICKEEGNGKKNEVVGDSKEREGVGGEDIKEESEVEKEVISKK